MSHPCAADSSTPSSTLSARAIHPLAAATLPWTDTCRNASQRASSAASARRPRRSYSANARSFSSIARACSPPNCSASPRPSRISAVSPSSAACSNKPRARSQSAVASASRPRRNSSSAVATPIAANDPTRCGAYHRRREHRAGRDRARGARRGVEAVGRTPPVRAPAPPGGGWAAARCARARGVRGDLATPRPARIDQQVPSTTTLPSRPRTRPWRTSCGSSTSFEASVASPPGRSGS